MAKGPNIFQHFLPELRNVIQSLSEQFFYVLPTQEERHAVRDVTKIQVGKLVDKKGHTVAP